MGGGDGAVVVSGLADNDGILHTGGKLHAG